jgi:hypothetical protein
VSTTSCPANQKIRHQGPRVQNAHKPVLKNSTWSKCLDISHFLSHKVILYSHSEDETSSSEYQEALQGLERTLTAREARSGEPNRKGPRTESETLIQATEALE